MSGVHAELAFSDAPRWVECPGAISLSEGLPPEPDTEETLEGNAADWVAKQYAAGNEVAYGSPTPVDGFTVDYDMIHGAKLWAATVGYGAISGVPVVSTKIHPDGKAWGDPDGWVWNPVERRLIQPDYKYGFGVVEPTSWQVIGYAAGELEALDLLHDPEVQVWLGIVQPRAPHRDGPVRWWKTTVGELRAYINVMHHSAIQALPIPGAGGELIQGAYRTQTGTHCFNCIARHHCETLQQVGGHVADLAGRANRTNMEPAALAAEYTILKHASKLLEARLTGQYAQIEGLMKNRKHVPGYKFTPTVARIAWNPGVTVGDVRTLGDKHNVVAVKTSKTPGEVQLITPTQMLTAGVPKDEVMRLATRGPDGMKVTVDDGSDARRAFA